MQLDSGAGVAGIRAALEQAALLIWDDDQLAEMREVLEQTAHAIDTLTQMELQPWSEGLAAGSTPE